MAKYYFNVRDGNDMPDVGGTELPTMAAVRSEAVRFAGESIMDLGAKFWDHRQWELVVTDEAGATVLTLTFSGGP